MSKKIIGNINITNLTTGTLSAGTLLATAASIGTLMGTDGTISNLIATTSSFGSSVTTTASSSTLLATNSSIENLDTTNITSSTACVTTTLSAVGNSNTLGSIVTTGGNVGIATTNPNAILDLQGGSQAGGVYGSPMIAFQYFYGGGFRHYIKTRHNNIIGNVTGNAIDFYLNNTNTANGSSTPGTGNVLGMSITGAGVGIGTSSPRTKFDVNGTNASMAIVARDEYESASLYFGTPYQGLDTSAVKAAIIAKGNTGWSRSALHFCLNNYADNSSTYNATVADSRMTILSNGYVGIGNSNPGFPLHATSTANWNVFSNGSQMTWTGVQSSVTGNYNVSIFADGWIGAQGGFVVWSDNRIKKDVIDIVDSEALSVFRQLQPKKYKYVDFVNRGTEEVYGFIAQQVEQILPNAVKTEKSMIPNIYTRANVTNTNETSEESVLEILDDSSKSPYYNLNDIKIGDEIQILNSQGEEKTYKITDVDVVNNKITIDKKLQDNMVFVYGTKVNDLKALNKDTIWTVTAAALQEVDRQLQAEKQSHAETKTAHATMAVELASLKAALQAKFPGEF